MSKEIEKRLADLEKGLKAAEKKAKAAEDRAAAAEELAAKLEGDNKRARAQLHDVKVQARGEVGRLQSMRDLHSSPSNPYEEDSRDRYEQLKRMTVKTKDGRRHYYSPLACYISDNGKPPFVYYPAESFVSLPADVDPSVTFEPVKVGGKDPKSGVLIFVPIDTKADEKEYDPGQDVEEDPSGDQVTNTELNDRAAGKRAKNAQTGPGAPAKPTPPQRPGANEPTDEQQPPADENAPEGSRPADTDVG
jgi:hypothetical protein